MTAARKKPTLLVTGAGGQLGRRVIELLLERKAGPVIATTRDPEKIKDLAARGVEVRRGDFDDGANLQKAFAGADRLLLISTDAVGRPGGRHPQHNVAVEAAVAAGVGHVVYTSVTSPLPSEADTIPNDHFWTEDALAASPLTWTFSRNNIYTDTILWSLPQAVTSGQLFSAAGDGGRSFVTREDCARVAAAALASDFDGRRILDVTGPAAVNSDQLAALASELTGRRVDHVRLSPADLRKGLLASGMPPAYADLTVAFDVAASQGYYAIVTPVVQEITGKAPTSVREYLTANRAALAAAA